MKKRLLYLFVATASVLAMVFANASSASAVSIELGVHLQHATAGGYCLDSNYRGSVYYNPCQAGNTYQEWNLLPYSENNTSMDLIQDVQTGLCLDASLGGVGTTNCTESSSEYFQSEFGYYGLEWFNQATDKCLDGNGSSVYWTSLPTCQYYNAYQNWYTLVI